MPLEPWQRLSQAVFEKWLKSLCDKNPLIDLRFGCKVEGVDDIQDGVLLRTMDVASGGRRQLMAQYLVGCDGGSSQVRRSLEIPLDGGPMPVYVLLIHFTSRDLTRLHAQGRFWHVFFVGDAGLVSTCIAQNEKDVWTTHLLLPMDQDSESIGSEEAVYRALGGIYGKYEIKIDEILVRSTYRPNIAIARTYSGYDGHVYLAGDAAHQNIPTGGYGMNMGIADAFELGWKMAAVVNGHAQPSILRTYEQERRTTAMTCIERSGVHMRVHMEVAKLVAGKAKLLDAETEEGHKLRQTVHAYYQEHDGENTDSGIEMGYRYKSNIIIGDGTKEPVWLPSEYTATTFPGNRAPHVFLRDGSPIFDHFGPNYTLVEFLDTSASGAHLLLDAACQNWMPIKHLVLKEETHAHSIYERRLVLVRPDGHVAWRSDGVQDPAEAAGVFATISGRRNVDSDTERSGAVELTMDESETGSGAFAFTATVANNTQKGQFELEKMGTFQA
ncbi:uncharacterized protein A1O9_12855 [Exophiala aquamarina CBS 119918]|uniref:FAD-binding domain-containing protein n=1 Tax=Exophiala aquamarina CBS 119918 TaxID=1182545 RepID=A0A072NVK7_9EURO|nr:uncharacterized protein A1O9_12855 [Exophiala aquamarina CBS 119918]KEF51073.1 hypothetical protein A1O9_12855 [Exophiala aquamarina CBS 119918]